MSRVKTIIKSATKLDELSAIVRYKMGEKSDRHEIDLEFSALTKSDMQFCMDALTKVSRSFAIVIQQLPPDLKEAVAIFYLVLRGLDTVEDDMTLDATYKDKMLRNFYKQCYLSDFKIANIGDTQDYQTLLANFDKVTRCFINLNEDYKEEIADVCFKMGNGMADYIQYEIETVKDYDVYCYYVAGLVGNGLSGLFAASGYENESLKNELGLANSMGLFLQKTNITRDYLEDYEAGRIFWPTEIWSKYQPELGDFAKQPNEAQSIAGLNAMVADATRHLTDCVHYLKMLRNEQVFRFCAIPQLMAIATMVELYNNAEVFKTNVKIRKGLTAKIMMDTKTFDDARGLILEQLDILVEKMNRYQNAPIQMWQQIYDVRTLLGMELVNPIVF